MSLFILLQTSLLPSFISGFSVCLSYTSYSLRCRPERAAQTCNAAIHKWRQYIRYVPYSIRTSTCHTVYFFPCQCKTEEKLEQHDIASRAFSTCLEIQKAVSQHPSGSNLNLMESPLHYRLCSLYRINAIGSRTQPVPLCIVPPYMYKVSVNDPVDYSRDTWPGIPDSSFFANHFIYFTTFSLESILSFSKNNVTMLSIAQQSELHAAE